MALKNCKVVLLDIEGTITSISFVKDVLFPYVRENLKSYLNDNWENEEVQNDVKNLKQLSLDQSKSDLATKEIPEAEKNETIESLIANITSWMDRDKKLPALKQLQGHMWRSAYEGRQIKGHLYPDVLPNIKKFKSEEINIYIYSSGSVQAQKLLLKYSTEGDITSLISGYYDTNIGLKTDVASYFGIAHSIGVSPSNITFFTDVEREALPCRDAGMNCVLVVRDGNSPLSLEVQHQFQIIKSFDEVFTS